MSVFRIYLLVSIQGNILSRISQIIPYKENTRQFWKERNLCKSPIKSIFRDKNLCDFGSRFGNTFRL